MYHASSSADENISMSMGLGGPDGCGGNGMFNDASSTEADGKKTGPMSKFCVLINNQNILISVLIMITSNAYCIQIVLCH